MSKHRRRPHPPARATLDPFTQRQVEMIRLRKMTGWLVTAGKRPPKAETVQAIRRVIRVLDLDGNVHTESEATQYVVTLRAITARIHVDQITAEQAQSCGFATAALLRDAWLTRHPRTEYVRHIAFELGDVRDRDWFMDRGGGYTTSPSHSIDPDAPVPISDALAWSDANRMTEAQRERKLRSVGLQAKRTAPDDLDEIRRLRDELDSLLDEDAA